MYLHTIIERSMTLSAKEAIKRFEACLQKRLPLEDDSFFVMVKRAGLLPQYSDHHVAALPTRAEKVSYFLQNVVESGADEYLPKLLGVMKKSGNRDVINLAYEIQETMGSGIRTCIFAHGAHMYICLVFSTYI